MAKLKVILLGGGGGIRYREEHLPNNPIIRDILPSSDWNEDSNGHYLHVHLPDFKREEVKLQVDTRTGTVTVSGKRQTSDNRYILQFHQTLTLPPNSDVDGIKEKFDSGILYVTVPKLIVQQQEAEIPKKENENTNSIAEEHKQDHQTPKNAENNDGDGSQVFKEEEKEKNSRIDDFPEDTIREWLKEPSQLVRAMRMLEDNKQIVFIALLAFSLGVWVSSKIGSGGHINRTAI